MKLRDTTHSVQPQQQICDFSPSLTHALHLLRTQLLIYPLVLLKIKQVLITFKIILINDHKINF